LGEQERTEAEALALRERTQFEVWVVWLIAELEAFVTLAEYQQLLSEQPHCLVTLASNWALPG
jgi:hypothetical protein